MSPRSDRPMMTGGDTLKRRCKGHDMSPRSDCLMMISGNTSEGVRAMIGAQLQNASEPM
jgi:hypothetical protein